MPAADRDDSHEQELMSKQQIHLLESGRASVPMWDSSDPDRAPPPLPLNPGSSSPVTKPNTSKNVAAVAEAFAAKARENTYTINSSPSKSPEKALVKGHKRLESLQPGALRGRNNYTEALRSLDRTPSPEKSPERLPRNSSVDIENRPPRRERERSETPTPVGRDIPKDNSAMRSSRPPLKAILGESTPPSATMLALQNMKVPDYADRSLSDITNASSQPSRHPHSFEAISGQILSLTTIATNLQKEMVNLTRRSKDNAADLSMLKDATTSRNEEIHRSLKDLTVSLPKSLDGLSDAGSRAASSFGHRPSSLLLEGRPLGHESTSRGLSSPRIGGPIHNSSELSSSSYGLEDVPASIALLERIWQDMGTKAGLEELSASLEQLQRSPNNKSSDPTLKKQLDDIHKSMRDNPAASRKLDEILDFVRQGTNNRAMTLRQDRDSALGSSMSASDLGMDHRAGPASVSRRDFALAQDAGKGSSPKAADFINDDLQKLLKKMKDSISEAGGMTAEVKAHLRELRGEVLGMGRDIARKLDEAVDESKAARNEDSAPQREDISQIVRSGLGDLKQHMEALMQERRRQSSSSIVSRHSVDSQEVYTAVKNALKEFPAPNQIVPHQTDSGINREEILDAVREAWETYKPEIELQNFGLEREEILQCLKEGLQSYQEQDHGRGLGSASYDEVLDAVKEGLRDFKAPGPIETEASITREEILMTVRECLESSNIPVPQHSAAFTDREATREDMLHAVQEGLMAQAPHTKDVAFNRDDLFDAVRAGLQDAGSPTAGVGEQVLDKMEELLDGMRVEFKQYSVASGGDTEQVLDAMKDGLEVLRADVEAYVDRAADVTGKDEIIETIKHGLDQLRRDVASNLPNNARSTAPTDSVELLDAMEKEFDHLRQTISTSAVQTDAHGPGREEILETIREAVEETRHSVPSASTSADAIEMVKDELSHLRETIASVLLRQGGAADKDEMLDAIREAHDSLRVDLGRGPSGSESVLSNTSELMDAFNEGLETLRSDMVKLVNKPLDMTVNYEILETLKDGLATVREDMDGLRAAHAGRSRSSTTRDGEVVVADPEVEKLHISDIGKLEVMITQLRIKVEALDGMPSSSGYSDGAVSKERIDTIESMLREVQSSVGELNQNGSGSMGKEDIEAFENLLRNTKAKVDDLASSDVEGIVRISHFDTLETLLKDTRDAVEDLESDGASKGDFNVLEALLKEVRAGLEELRDRDLNVNDAERVTRTDIEALETLCMDTKTQIAELEIPDPGHVASKLDIETLGNAMQRISNQALEQHEMNGMAFEARKTEHAGIADKIEDFKLILEDVRGELNDQINNGHNSVQDLAKIVDSIAETIMTADIDANFSELRDLVRQEFDASQKANDGVKDHNETNHTVLLERHETCKNHIIQDVNARLDARFDELMTKYDDAQIKARDNARATDDKEGRREEAMNVTKTVAEDLRLLVDALGTTVTESCDRMSEDSKTVFIRVEDIGTKLDDLLSNDAKADHHTTHAELSKTLASIEGVHAHVSEYNPRILEAVKDVLSIVGQHYEQTKTSTEEIKTSVQAIPGAIPLPAIAPSPGMARDLSSREKYDDSAIQQKLDRLVSHVGAVGATGVEIGVLEQIREQVAATATQLTDFVALQQANNSKALGGDLREADEAAVALEKRTAQKSVVEADIVRLFDEKSGLTLDVEALRQEKDELTSLKAKMQADLSSLETALLIRREELQIMEARADGLERRVLDGILDHSRSLLTTSRPQSSLREMNLKRVTSTSSNATSATRASTMAGNRSSAVPSAVSSGIGIALRRREAPRSSNGGSNISKAERRILSLSTIGTNKSSPNDRAMVLAVPSAANGGTRTSGIGVRDMKRSHSVKSSLPSRQTSWAGSKAANRVSHDRSGLLEDKENSIFDEAEEDDMDGSSDTGTERRTSYSGTFTGTGSYGEGSTFSRDDHRTSYAASTVGTIGSIGTRDFAMDGHDESHGDGHQVVQHHDLYLAKEAYAAGDGAPMPTVGEDGEIVLFGGGELGEHGHGHGSDSGIGTDIPTAQMKAGDGYF